MNVKLAFSDDFFEACTRMPPNIQQKVNQLIVKFQADPKANGLNYEKLKGLKKKNFHSVRVDLSYRVILSSPKEGGVYVFLWVDYHDDAYDWALSHRCEVNRNTGALQIYTTSISDDEEVEPITPHALPDLATPATGLRLFIDLKDRELLKLGVPDEQLELVRNIDSEAALDRVQSKLPQEAYEGLFLYFAGEQYEDILREREIDEAQTFGTEDFLQALERVQSMARFVVPQDETELVHMLNAPLEKWRVFLHPSQRRLADGEKNGAVRVLGGAGTGKTVVAMHRAKWLAAQTSAAGHKILFTTFTKNLAVDIQQNLNSICDKDLLGRIEVINLDKWVQGFLQKHSYDYNIAFNQQDLEPLWKKAISEKPSDLDFSDSFFREEWQRVIQPQNVKSVDDYKRASRIGRGTRLNREQRIRIWPVFDEYRHQLNRARLKETDDAYRDATELISTQGLGTPYSSVVVDEAQDMGTQAFHLLRAMVPEGKNDLFLVGDAHQRIYGKNRVVLGQCGINIRGRSRKLKINYRTTDEIRQWAVKLLAGRAIDDLDGGTDNNAVYKSLTHGDAPMVERFETPEEQAAYIKAVIEQGDVNGAQTCVVARTNNEVAAIRANLEKLNVECITIKPNEPESSHATALKLATVHRIKGLEFDQMILASANDGLLPLSVAMRNKGDAISLEEAETEERSLVYVAITRARKKAFVLSYGVKSKFFD
jgi:mRNA-degrading endonuclease RelE of RelBE toxin-antitoxin system